MELPIPDYDLETPSKGKLIGFEKVNNILDYTFKRELNSL